MRAVGEGDPDDGFGRDREGEAGAGGEGVGGEESSGSVRDAGVEGDVGAEGGSGGGGEVGGLGVGGGSGSGSGIGRLRGWSGCLLIIDFVFVVFFICFWVGRGRVLQKIVPEVRGDHGDGWVARTRLWSFPVEMG